MAELAEIVKYWAADREAVSSLGITNIEFDFDKGWPGTDVTPGDMPEIIVKYTVTRDVIYRRNASELSDFLTTLVHVAKRVT